MNSQQPKSTPEKKEEYKKVCFYVYKRQDAQIRIIAKEQQSEYATVIRGILDKAIAEYLNKNAPVMQVLDPVIFAKEENPNAQGGYCQNSGCVSQGKCLPRKKLHQITVVDEKFIFCDDCFYNKKYKNYVSQMI